MDFVIPGSGSFELYTVDEIKLSRGQEVNLFRGPAYNRLNQILLDFGPETMVYACYVARHTCSVITDKYGFVTGLSVKQPSRYVPNCVEEGPEKARQNFLDCATAVFQALGWVVRLKNDEGELTVHVLANKAFTPAELDYQLSAEFDRLVYTVLGKINEGLLLRCLEFSGSDLCIPDDLLGKDYRALVDALQVLYGSEWIVSMSEKYHHGIEMFRAVP